MGAWLILLAPGFNWSSYPQISDASRTFVGNKIVDHSDVFVASRVGAALNASTVST